MSFPQHGALSFGNIELVVQSLMDKVAAQSVAITQLQTQLQQVASAEHVAKANARTESALLALHRKLERIDDSLAVTSADAPTRECQRRQRDGNGDPVVDLDELAATDVTALQPGGNIGAVVAANRAALTRLARRVDAAVSGAELEESERRFATMLETELRRARDGAVGRLEMERMEEAQAQMQVQLRSLTESLQHKVENAELSRLEAAAAKVGSFGEWSRGVNAKLEALDDATERTRQGLEEHVSIAAALSRETLALRETMETKAATDQVDALNKQLRVELNNLGETLRSAAEKKGAADDARAVAMEAAARKAKNELDQRLAALRTELHASLSKRATLVQLGTKADAATCDKILLGYRSEINGKAEAEDLQRVTRRVGELGNCCAVLQKHVELANRFIDWFAERGSAYEHNFNVVEGQLGKLGEAAAAGGSRAQRQPYDPRIRMGARK